MAVIATPLANSLSQLRPFNPGRDSKAATDLVELCFADTLDPDGRSYLNRLHESAYRNILMDWVSPFEPATLPRIGYVWEEAGRLVGYLSVIPFFNQRQSCYLIANVAVHPDMRGRGIGRALTRQALDYASKHHAKSTWLQVRADNSSAVHIYKTEGFVERARRTNWESQSAPLHRQEVRCGDEVLSVRARRSQDWKDHQTWLDVIYPPELAWHLPVDRQAIDPGLGGTLYRIFNWLYPLHWVAQVGREMRGILSYLPGEGHADALWLALPDLEASPIRNQMLLTLLRCARRETPRHRPLSLNLPDTISAEVMLDAGFSAQQTLLWMECKS